MIFNKNTKILIFCLFFIIVLIKVSTISFPIKKSQLTGSLINSSMIEDLGIQFQVLGTGADYMFFDGNGDPHYFIGYSGKVQFLDINLATGATTYFNTGKSGLAVGAREIVGNKFYIIVGDNCSVWEYDITAGTFTELKQSGSSNGCGLSTVGQSAYTAPDGIVYIGTAHKSTVYEIDPATGNIRDFGVIDPPNGNPTCTGCASRQVAKIAADLNYIYALMRDTSTNSYWLAILNRSDGSLSASCDKDALIQSGLVSASMDGTQIWYNSSRVDNTNGQCPTTTGTPPTLKPWFYASTVYSPVGDNFAQAASVFNADIDKTDVDVDTSTGGITTIRYRYPAGSGSWTTVTQPMQMYDSAIKRIKNIDGTNAYLVAGNYGPNSLFNGTTTNVLGRTSQSTYAITPIGQYVYLSGYTANTFRYTPALPWTLTGSNQTTCSVGSPSNPCLAFQGMGKYHYYTKAAANGKLYISSDYKRGSRGGGDIGWIDPATGSTGSYAFTCDAPAGFALLSDDTTLAYSGSGEDGSFGCTNTVGKVYMFDTTTHTVKTSFVPVAGADDQGVIIGTNDGGILGVAQSFPSAGQYTMYKVDANGNHASWSPMVVTGNIFGSTAGSDQFLIKARNGMIYTIGDNNEVIQINPNDGSRTSFVTASSWITAMEFVGEDLYMAVGSNSSNLQRIRGVDPVLASDKTINSFTFNTLSPAVSGTVNEVNHTVSVTVPYGTNVTALAPTVAIIGASVSPNTGVAQDFTNPVTYTVTANDASAQAYTVSVTVASNTTVSSNGGSGGSGGRGITSPSLNNGTLNSTTTEPNAETKTVLNQLPNIITTPSTTKILYQKLKKGDTGDQVILLQTVLKSQGPTIYPTNEPVDGIFGRTTLKSVKTFQSRYNLIPDGVVGFLTRSMTRKVAQ